MSTGLLLALPGALSALVYWISYCWQEVSATKSATKTLSTLALAAAAATLGAPPAITAGLALGALGDLALSRKGDRAFLAGMGAFAAGHLAYAAAFLSAATGLPPLWPALAVLALGLSTEVWLAPRTGALRWPVRGYVVVICAMALAALALPVAAWPVLLGAILFLASDLLLAIEIFLRPDRPSRLLSRAVWAAYWSGQALIGLGGVALASSL
ncbi:lysoplasmalogenase family protein [Acidimangrovimonas pyrenivorans]|uniref:Lysoplasmalogenase family protein n=1 Tax=Acidimangrovimonas pyrenivorans TaxID=2030798 RepID=A0ABV7AHV7_9RHOB